MPNNVNIIWFKNKIASTIIHKWIIFWENENEEVFWKDKCVDEKGVLEFDKGDCNSNKGDKERSYTLFEVWA